MRFDWSTFDVSKLDWSPLWISCKTAALSTLITFMLGLWAAWRLCKASPRVNSILDGVFTLPMVLPPTVVGVVLLLLFGKNSFFGQLLLSLGTQVVFSWSATVIAAVVVTLPLMYRTARGAFEQLDQNLLSAARTLGLSEISVFFRIALPLSWPGVAAGAVLAFARALGEFGATLMLAGNIAGRTQTMPIAIYFAVQGGKNELVLFWVGIIVILSFTVIAIMNHIAKGKRRTGA